jgi:hypothetical protein
MKIQAGKEYRSRRGERVLVTAVEESSPWPVHFIVMDGPYKGVGKRDGSRLTIDGRALASNAGKCRNHLNDLIAAWTAGGSSDQPVAPTPVQKQARWGSALS